MASLAAILQDRSDVAKEADRRPLGRLRLFGPCRRAIDGQRDTTDGTRRTSFIRDLKIFVMRRSTGAGRTCQARLPIFHGGWVYDPANLRLAAAGAATASSSNDQGRPGLASGVRRMAPSPR